MATASAPVSSRRQKLLASLLEKTRSGSGGACIPRRAAGLEPLPLSSGQQRLWFLEQISSGSPVYNVPTCFRVQGPLDVEAFRQSLEVIVRRHEILRTTFAARDGEPAQIVSNHAGITFSTADLSAGSGFRAAAVAEAQRPFDLTRGPLLRVLLIELAKDDHVVVITMHHIVCDGWSMGILFRELGAIYASLKQGAGPALPELAIQYADYATWQRERLRSGALNAQIDYWREHLKDAPPVFELPADKPRPRRPGFRGAIARGLLDTPVADVLLEIARNESTTSFVVLLAAYSVFLNRHSGQSDFVVGCPVSNRNRAELEPMIGFFPNTLPLRIDTSGNPGFIGLVRALRETAAQAFTNAEAPFDVIASHAGGTRAAHQRLFQVAFTTQEETPLRTTFGEIEISPIELDLGTAKCDLTLTATIGRDGISLAFEYDEDLFLPDTARRMCDRFAALAGGIAADPESPVASLPVMPERERIQILSGWSRTLSTEPEPLIFPEMFEQHAARDPQAPALLYRALSIDYGQLDRRANQIAHLLRQSGAGPGALVAIALGRSPELIAAILGVLKSGAAYLPLALDHPADRIAFQMEDAHPMMLISTPRDRDSLPPAARRVEWLDLSSAESHAAPEASLPCLARPSDLAYVIYTSGSTGKPKGAMLEHRGLANLARAQQALFHPRPGQRVLQFAAPTFDASVWEIAMALGSGACLCLGSGSPFVPEELARVLREQRVNFVTLPPSLLRALNPSDFSDLETVISAGEDCPESLAREWSGGRSFFNCYGPTETTVCATAFRYDPASQVISIGRPLPNMQTYILDREMQPVPTGVPGELHVGGAGVARGYLNRADLTRTRFVTNPFEAGECIYKTGDLARYLPGGDIQFLGRIDGQIKLRGHRVEIGEIEACLGSHPEVQECAVVLRTEDGLTGEKIEPRLVAYFVARAQVDGDALRAFAGKTLPHYMIPSAFVPLGDLPVNSSGKIDRRALAQMSLRAEGPRVDARDEIEKTIADIWAEALGLGSVDVTHNFFELGGNSLMALSVLEKIADRTGCRLPATALFEAGTVEQIARIVRERRSAGSAGSLVHLQAKGAKPPLIVIPPAGGSLICYSELARLLGPDQPVSGVEPAPGRRPPDTVEALAAQYVRHLDHVVSQGPFQLSGWSFGGVVAFEMARQLARDGRAPELVVLLDSHLTHERQDPDDSDILLEIGRVQALARGVEFRLKGRKLRRLEPHLRAMLIAAQINRESGTKLETIAAALRTTLQQFRANMTAAHRYAPREYDGRVVLMRALVRAAEGRQAGDYGWSRCCPNLRICDVPGTHRSMLTQPHVTALSRSLRELFESRQ